jgi:hypothetical protein
MQKIKEVLQFLLGNLIVSALFAMLLALDFGLTGWLLWGPIVAQPASAPGARDGAGLLVLGVFWFLATGVVTALVGAIQGTLLKNFFPWWEPPEP